MQNGTESAINDNSSPDSSASSAEDRAIGALVGLACGDAVGTTLEFRAPGTFEPIDDMVGGGPFGLEPGQWTDDTSMALCLAESIIDTGGHGPGRPAAALPPGGVTRATCPRTVAASTSASPPTNSCPASN